MSRGLLLLVFLSGVAAAVLISFIITESRKNASDTSSSSSSPHLLPDSAHIEVIEESTIFATKELQRPKSRAIKKAADEDGDCGVSEPEALKSVTAAVGSSSAERASKLFRHAVALCPKHPRILNLFGEFLEETGRDILEADHFFVRAATFANDESEDHARALQNRKRTALMVEEIDRRMLNTIDNKKKAFQRINANGAAMKRAKKEAYFQHVYHTVGIEGNTMTLAQTRSILETKLAVGGKSVMEHNEVLGLDAALRYINQTLVDRVGEITTQDILEIHKRVVGYVDPVEVKFPTSHAPTLFRFSRIILIIFTTRILGRDISTEPSFCWGLRSSSSEPHRFTHAEVHLLAQFAREPGHASCSLRGPRPLQTGMRTVSSVLHVVN